MCAKRQADIVHVLQGGLLVYNGDVLSRRIKVLRTVYGVSRQKLSDLTSLAAPIGTTTIRYWETQQRIPTLSALQSVADLFAVSLDWISGRREKPYDDDVMLSLERELMPLVMPLQNQEDFIVLPCAELQIPKEYQDEKKRPIYYPIGVRANIVFWLNCLKYEIVSQSLIVENPNSDDGRAALKLSEVSQNLMKQYNDLFHNIRLNLPKSIAVKVPEAQPLWDLEKSIQEKENI